MAAITKFNETTRAAILGAMRIGVTHLKAAEAAGVDRTTLYRWLQKGEADAAQGRHTEHAAFVKAFREAEAQVIGQVESNVVQASASDWRAGAWWLGKKWPDRYGDVTLQVKQAMANELLDFLQKWCAPDVYRAVLQALDEHGEMWGPATEERIDTM